MHYGLAMNIRIISASEGDQTVLQIAGRLRSGDLSELDKAIQSGDGSFVLDLTDLQSADEAGIVRLRELAAGNGELRGVSPYVQMLLDGNS